MHWLDNVQWEKSDFFRQSCRSGNIKLVELFLNETNTGLKSGLSADYIAQTLLQMSRFKLLNLADFDVYNVLKRYPEIVQILLDSFAISPDTLHNCFLNASAFIKTTPSPSTAIAIQPPQPIIDFSQLWKTGKNFKSPYTFEA